MKIKLVKIGRVWFVQIPGTERFAPFVTQKAAKAAVKRYTRMARSAA